MLQRIEYARRQALEARENAAACLDNRIRDEWDKAAALWEMIAAQYELLRGFEEAAASRRA